MTAGVWTFTNSTRTNLLNGTFDLDSDNGVTNEVANGNGYTTGGVTVSPLALSGTTSVSVKFGTNPSWTASSSGITARWAVVYEVGGNVLCFCLLDNTPANVVVTSGNTLTIDGTTTALFTLA